jgi:hypothetical protein
MQDAREKRIKQWREIKESRRKQITWIRVEI